MVPIIFGVRVFEFFCLVVFVEISHSNGPATANVNAVVDAQRSRGVGLRGRNLSPILSQLPDNFLDDSCFWSRIRTLN